MLMAVRQLEAGRHGCATQAPACMRHHAPGAQARPATCDAALQMKWQLGEQVLHPAATAHMRCMLCRAVLPCPPPDGLYALGVKGRHRLPRRLVGKAHVALLGLQDAWLVHLRGGQAGLLSA